MTSGFVVEKEGKQKGQEYLVWNHSFFRLGLSC